MQMLCVNGTLASREVDVHPIIQTKWASWKKMFPNAMVVNNATGFNRDYKDYPYGSYKDINNNNLIFPVRNEDTRLPKKERVLGVITESFIKAYRQNSFINGISIIREDFGNQKLIVIGSKSDEFYLAYHTDLVDNSLEFQPVQNSLPIIMTDNEGGKWDIFGECVEGTRMGTRLLQAKSMMAYWFAWAAFYPQTEINN